MLELGFLKPDEWTQTMKKHSKSKRHKKYVVEYKYNKYLKWKNAQKNRNKE